MNIKSTILLTRPQGLFATVVPLIVGGAIAYKTSNFNLTLWIIAFAVALLLQMGTNVFNEYSDYIHGIDTPETHGYGVLVRKEASPQEAFKLGIGIFVAAYLLSIPLILTRGLLVLVMGVIATLVGIFYSLGPLPISKTPFGELVVGLTMGFLEVIATEFVSSDEITILGYLVSIPVSLLVSSILLANNIRDIEIDRKVRRTLAVVIGRKYASWVYYMEYIISYAWVFLFYEYLKSPYAFLPFLSSPFYIYILMKIKKEGWKFADVYSFDTELVYGITLLAAILLA